MPFLPNNCRQMQSYFMKEEAKQEQEWLFCRKTIIFTGSMLCFIYGLAILTATQWLSVESTKLTESLAAINATSIANGFFASIGIMFIGFIGSITPWIKSKNLESIQGYSDQNHNKVSKRVKSYVVSENESRNRSIISKSWDEYTDSIIKMFKISPLLAIIIIFIGIFIPIELGIIVSTSRLLSQTDVSFECLDCIKPQELIFRLSICLTILYISVIAIQISILIYIIDLVRSYLKVKVVTKQMSPVLRHLITSRRLYPSPSLNTYPRSSRKLERKLNIQNEKNNEFELFSQKYRLSFAPRKSDPNKYESRAPMSFRDKQTNIPISTELCEPSGSAQPIDFANYIISQL